MQARALRTCYTPTHPHKYRKEFNPWNFNSYLNMPKYQVIIIQRARSTYFLWLAEDFSLSSPFSSISFYRIPLLRRCRVYQTWLRWYYLKAKKKLALNHCRMSNTSLKGRRWNTYEGMLLWNGVAYTTWAKLDWCE